MGRTGTLIALDVLLRQLECEGVVGPFSFVKKMRESRPLMVQTEVTGVFGGWGGGWRWNPGSSRPQLGRAPLTAPSAPPQAQYVFLHQCLLRFLQQSAPLPAKKNEAVYENLLFENDEAVSV